MHKLKIFHIIIKNIFLTVAAINFQFETKISKKIYRFYVDKFFMPYKYEKYHIDCFRYDFFIFIFLDLKNLVMIKAELSNQKKCRYHILGLKDLVVALV